MLYKPQATPASLERQWRSDPKIRFVLWAEMLDPGSVEHRSGRIEPDGAHGRPASWGAKRFGLWIQDPATTRTRWLNVRLQCPAGFNGRAASFLLAAHMDELRLASNKETAKLAKQRHGDFMAAWVLRALETFVSAVKPGSTSGALPRMAVISQTAAQMAAEDLGEDGLEYVDGLTDYVDFTGGDDPGRWLPYLAPGEADADTVAHRQLQANQLLLWRKPTEEDLDEWKLRVDKIKDFG